MFNVSVYLLGQSSHVFAMVNFKITHIPMNIKKKNEEREDNGTF